MASMIQPALLVEFATIFVLLPLVYRLLPVVVQPLPLLWVVTAYCYIILRHDPEYSPGWLWNAHGALPELGQVLALFAVAAGVIVLGVWRRAPHLLFRFPRRQPRLWAAVMVLYPTLSVYPQSIVYRSFLMHRYAAPLSAIRAAISAALSTPVHPAASPQMDAWLLVLLSAAAFGYLHIIFRNRFAIWMTFAGGLLFAWRYQTTHSLALASLEHALYGCLMFTVGLGDYFYSGRVQVD